MPKNPRYRFEVFRRILVGGIVGIVVLGFAVPAGAQAKSPNDPTDSIEVSYKRIDTDKECVPIETAQGSVSDSPSQFVVNISTPAPICEEVNAAVYKMPNSYLYPWPQQLNQVVNIDVPAGTTTIRFEKSCLPAQFDVVTGRTPDRIQPSTGPMHGPLIFDFLPYSATQHFPQVDCDGNPMFSLPDIDILGLLGGLFGGGSDTPDTPAVAGIAEIPNTGGTRVPSAAVAGTTAEIAVTGSDQPSLLGAMGLFSISLGIAAMAVSHRRRTSY